MIKSNKGQHLHEQVKVKKQTTVLADSTINMTESTHPSFNRGCDHWGRGQILKCYIKSVENSNVVRFASLPGEYDM